MKRITLVVLTMVGSLFFTSPQHLSATNNPPSASIPLNVETPAAWGVKVSPANSIPADVTLPGTWVSTIPLGWINEKSPKYRITFTLNETTLQKCRYSSENDIVYHDLYRERLSVTVKVMDATQENFEIASRTFVGSEPERCQETAMFFDTEKIKRVLGGWPEVAPFATWLATVMQGKLVTAHPLQPRLRLTGHKLPITDIAYSADAKFLASTSQDQVVYIWSATSGKISRSLKTGHTGSVNVARFSPDGKLLVTGGTDKLLRMWNLANGKQVFSSDQHTAAIDEIAFSPDGLSLATISDKRIISLLDATTGEIEFTLYTHRTPMLLLRFSDDGQQVLGISNDNLLFTWSVTTGKELSKVALTVKGQSNLVALSPDGQWLVTIGNSSRLAPVLSNIQSGEVVHQLTGHKDQVVSLRFSPDGKYILTASKDGTARVWDAATGEDLLQLPYHIIGVLDAVFSPDGKYIVTISPDKIGRVWQMPKELVPVPPKK